MGEGETGGDIDTDVNDDGVTSPIDALLVINYLNNMGSGALGEGEADLSGGVVAESANGVLVDSLLTDVQDGGLSQSGGTIGVRDTGTVYGPAAPAELATDSLFGDESEDVVDQIAIDIEETWKREV